MNKNGIALAADSAVTIQTSSGVKIYNTANKLFNLSKYNPVGIMIYGNASFMDIPWETIVKIYRNKIGKKSFPCLVDYAKHFLEFFITESQIFSKNRQEEYFETSLSAYYSLIRKNIDDRVKLVINTSNGIDDNGIKGIIEDVIDQHYSRWQEYAMLPTHSNEYLTELINTHIPIIRSIRHKIFKNLPISRVNNNKLNKIAGWLFTKDRFPTIPPV